jgi:hypothetical protein
MNLTHKKSLMLAVAAALGTVTPLAHASLITSLLDGKDDSARKFAIEEQGEATKDYYGRVTTSASPDGSIVDQDLTIHIPIISGYTVSLSNRMNLTLTLTGGAKFANKPYLVCAHSATNAAATTTIWRDGTLAKNTTDPGCLLSAAGGILNAGGTQCDTAVGGLTTDNGASAYLMSPDTGGSGSVTASFTLPQSLITRVGANGVSGAGCILTFGQASKFENLVSGGHATQVSSFVTAFTIGSRQDIGLKADVTYVDAGITTTKTWQGTIIKFVTALGATMVAGPTQVIDVGKKSSKEFEAGTSVKIGTITLTAAQAQPTPALPHPVPRVSRSYEEYLAGNANLMSGMVSGFSVTISGPTIAGAKEAWLDTSNTCAKTTTYGITSVATTSGGSSVVITVTAIDYATTVPYFNASTPLNICLSVPGTTVLSDGQLTATLTGLPKSTSFILDLGSGGNLSKIDRNGAVVRVLNVPAVGNADQGFFRFYNTSSQPTQVRATLYGQDGKIVGTENSVLFSALKPNDVEILDAAKLQAKLGATAPWTGRAWLLIQADVDKEAFKVQAMIRSPGTPGVLVNLSGEAYN